MISKEQLEVGHQRALESQQRSYSPYSRFAVGAALKIKGQDQWIVGCNVENSSYGATVCAERIAVFSAIASGHREFEGLVLVTQTETGDLPCALCLQVLSEFVGPDFPIYSANSESVVKTYKFQELLPHPFDRSNLPDASQ